MSVKAMTWVWEHSQHKGSALLVLLAIADMANDDGDCWPGVGRLAQKCRMKERNLQLILRALETSGELQTFLNDGTQTATGKTNRYHLPVVEGVQSSVKGVIQITPLTVQRGDPECTPSEQGVIQNAPLPTARGDQDCTPGVIQITPDPKVEPKVLGASSSFEDSSLPALKIADAGASAPATPPPKGTTSRKDGTPTIPAATINPMKDALVAAFGWAWETMTKAEKGQIQSAARELCLVKVGPERVPALYAYCQRMFDHFGPMALVNNKSQAEQRKEASNGKTPAVHRQHLEGRIPDGFDWPPKSR